MRTRKVGERVGSTLVWMVFRRGEQEQHLAVADLLIAWEEVAARARQVAGGRRIVVYSDPPWNPGNEKWWRRHAGAEPPARYDDLLDAWSRCAAAVRPWAVFCEQSANDKHRAMLVEAAKRCPDWCLPLRREWTVYYGSPGARSCTRPNVLQHYGLEDLTTDPAGLAGMAMSRRVFEGFARAGDLLVDPCMGKGMTSRLAHEFGASCVGAELNHTRLEHTTRWLLRNGYKLVEASVPLGVEARVAAYNSAVAAAAALVRDIADDPCLRPQLLRAERVRANDYNPNHTASPEMDLLDLSIRSDGVTMPVVVASDAGGHVVVDGFHRRSVLVARHGRAWIPCSVIDKPAGDRMASTVRHNRARGKHGVELMGALVRRLVGEGWDDARIAEHLGMSVEELLRLKQVVGAAKILAAAEFSQSWGRADEPDLPDV